MGRVQFWLSHGKQRLQLPVNPEGISITSPFGFEDVNVARLGEITIIGDRYQKEFTFSSFFPRDYNVSYCEYSRLPKPKDAVKLIESLRDKRVPIKFTVTGTKISYNVTIRDFTIEPERAGSPGDIYYSITLKEYRSVAIKSVKQAKSKSTDRPSNANNKVTTYTVVKGDSLSKIAAKPSVYGNASKWPTIYEANKKLIGKNPNLIYPGQKLVIPR